MIPLALYIIRWQASTFILAPVMWGLAHYEITNPWIVAGVGNLLGALVFFQVDKRIFGRER